MKVEPPTKILATPACDVLGQHVGSQMNEVVGRIEMSFKACLYIDQSCYVHFYYLAIPTYRVYRL